MRAGRMRHAIMYLAVIDVAGRRLGFYNGNEFGKDGIGVVVSSN